MRMITVTPKYVLDAVCNARHDEIRREVIDIKTEIKDIRENHLVHLNTRLDNLQLAMILLGLISGASLCIKILELVKVIP